MVLNEQDHWSRRAEVVYCGINSRAEKGLTLVATMAVIRKCGRSIPRDHTRGSPIRRVSDWSNLLYALALQVVYWQVGGAMYTFPRQDQLAFFGQCH